jgi:hypothetical protein
MWIDARERDHDVVAFLREFSDFFVRDPPTPQSCSVTVSTLPLAEQALILQEELAIIM